MFHWPGLLYGLVPVQGDSSDAPPGQFALAIHSPLTPATQGYRSDTSKG